MQDGSDAVSSDIETNPPAGVIEAGCVVLGSNTAIKGTNADEAGWVMAGFDRSSSDASYSFPFPLELETDAG